MAVAPFPSRFPDAMKDGRKPAAAVLLALMLGGCALFERTELQPGPHTAVLRGADWGKVYRGG